MDQEKKESGSPLLFAPKDAPLRFRQRQPYPEQLTMMFSILILAIFPLLMGPKGYNSITEFKYDLFAILTLGFVVLLLLLVALYAFDPKMREVRLKEGREHLSLPQALLIAFVLSAGISSLLSPYGTDTWIGQGRYEGMATILLYAILFLATSLWGQYTNWYVYAMGAAMILFSVIGILQFLGLNFPPIYLNSAHGYSAYHFVSTIGNIDMVSGLAAIILPALACGYILLEDKLRYWLCLPGYALLLYVQIYINVDSGKVGLLAALLVVLPILFTTALRVRRILHLASLSCLTAALLFWFPMTNDGASTYQVGVDFSGKVVALLAAAVLCLLAAYLVGRHGEFRISPKKLRRIVIIIEIILVIIALVFLYTYGGDSRVLSEISKAMHGNLVDEAGSGRGYVWKKSVTLIGDAPLFGSGPDTFRSRFEPFNAEYNAIRGTNVYFDYAHNDFLQIAINEGLIGLALYLAFIVSLAVRAFKVADRNPLTVIFGASVVAYLAHSFFSFSIAIITPLFWVMAGLLEKCIRQTTTEHGRIHQRRVSGN